MWKDGRVEQERWWRICFEPVASVSRREAVASLREALVESMRRHFVSDVPVGIFLSGGIDSTALVALARHIGVKDIATFSIGVDDPGLDESSMAARTAAHFQTRHHELRLDAEAGRARFEDFIKHIDQPSIDGFNTFTVSSFAKENGLKVVLSGLGSDELFGGYPSFQAVPSLVRKARWLGSILGLAHHTGAMLEYRSHSHRIQRLGAFLQGPLSISRAHSAFRGVFSRRSARLLAARYAGVPLAEFLTDLEARTDELEAGNDLDEVSRCELTCYMRNQLLRDSDVMSMAHSLELRVPFVDRKLFEAVSGIPAAIRLQQGKRLLIDAVPELPAWVMDQRKKGFLFPYQQWAQSTWGAVFKETNARLPVRSTTWYQTWCAFMLDQWIESQGAKADA
jgi:asparagine synthase (glutamine-hydrolysing)